MMETSTKDALKITIEFQTEIPKIKNIYKHTLQYGKMKFLLSSFSFEIIFCRNEQKLKSNFFNLNKTPFFCINKLHIYLYTKK